MIKILRKLFIKAPHLRFAGFLNIYSFMWSMIMIMLCVAMFNATKSTFDFYNYLYKGIGIGTCLGFFFFYRYTSKILKSYSQEGDADRFLYLKFINPVAPIIYISTVLLIVFIIANMIMGVIYMVGSLLYILGIALSLGLVLLDNTYKHSDFVSGPEKFFDAENYFFEHYISIEFFFIFFILIYFVIPFGTCLLILFKHSEEREPV
jgi:hypothetical protein